jgi:pyridoxal phosphate enzyme (YggS family)
MSDLAQNYRRLQNALSACAVQSGHEVRLLAVSKTQSPERIRQCADLGQKAFGENYVQEALEKITALRQLALEWHMIGPLQSNKCPAAAAHFDWVQTVDREKIIKALDQHRPENMAPLNVLIQVNIDAEPGKSGCAPSEIKALALHVAACRNLRLRGLMAIPDPATSANGMAFSRMQQLFVQLRENHPVADTLSMGMSDDFPAAIAHGANLVRVGSALFGQRPSKQITP